MAIKDGGPAFSGARWGDVAESGRLYSEGEGNEPAVVYYSGMSLRDYFAAHAPVEPQTWFQPTMPPRPAPVYDHAHPSEFCMDCSPMNWQDRDAWLVEQRKQRFIQWPFAWADAMLAEREK